MSLQKKVEFVPVPKDLGCREHILIAEALTNKLNVLLLEGVEKVEVHWIDVQSRNHPDDPANRGYKILALRGEV